MGTSYLPSYLATGGRHTVTFRRSGLEWWINTRRGCLCEFSAPFSTRRIR